MVAKMILTKGNKVLVVHRLLFEDDQLRYFFGTVEEYESGIVKFKGCTWLRYPHTTTFFLKDEERTKIISASSGTHIIYELSNWIFISFAHFQRMMGGFSLLTIKIFKWILQKLNI